jgi:hypothetical protein
MQQYDMFKVLDRNIIQSNQPIQNTMQQLG